MQQQTPRQQTRLIPVRQPAELTTPAGVDAVRARLADRPAYQAATRDPFAVFRTGRPAEVDIPF